MEENCLNCKLQDSTLRTSFIRGNNGVLIIGESPKAELGFMLANVNKYPALKRLKSELEGVNIVLEDCSFTEIILCELPDRKDFKIVARNCLPALIETIKLLRPKLIISFGVLIKEVLEENFRTNLRMGEVSEIGCVKYLPIYHPSPANPTGHLKNLEILAKLDKNAL